MSTGLTVLLTLAFLAAPVCLLVGVGAGACLVWRVSKGMAPLPALSSLFKRKVKVIDQKPLESDRPKPPKVAA